MIFDPIMRPLSCGLALLVLLGCFSWQVCAEEADSIREKRNQLLRQFRLANSSSARRAILDQLMALRLKDRPRFGIYQCVDEKGNLLDGSGTLPQEMFAFLKNCAYRPETRSQTLDRLIFSYGFEAVKSELEKYLQSEDSSLKGAARRVYERALVVKFQAPLEGIFSSHLKPEEQSLPLEIKIDLLLERLDPNPTASGDPIANLDRTEPDRAAISLLEAWSTELLTPGQKHKLSALSRNRMSAELDLKILDRLRRSACSHLEREVGPYLDSMMESAYLRATQRNLAGDSWVLADNQIYRWGVLRTQRWGMADSPGLHRLIGNASAARYRALKRFEEEVRREMHRPGSNPKRKARLETLLTYQNWSGSTLSGTWGSKQSLQSVIDAALGTAREHGVNP
ncbi:MAG: hypothetical protein QF752_11080 [Planctomycetota bacterium]|jgi:hypothetical protein|nr:hypothetical protein [Planctomycetota bacterium]